jgi:signal transduction histidine kinase
MTARAARRGGSFHIGPATHNGTVVEWRVPVG